MKKKKTMREETLSNSMENTDWQGLFHQNPPVNLLNPMPLSLPYPNSHHNAYCAPFQNPNLYPVQQSCDSNSQIDVIHPPGVEPPPTVTHISSASAILPPLPSFTYLHDQAIASSSTPLHHYYHDPNVQLALPPFGIGTGITEPTTVTDKLVATNITSSLSINHKVGSQECGTRIKGPKKIKIVQSAWCEICKVDCNSKSILDQHKLGKKHKKNLWKLMAENGCILTQSSAATPAQAPASIPAQKARKKAAVNEDLETKTRKMLEGGVAAKDVRMCTICNVVCNSEMVFMHHLAGQKHATMMKKSASAAGMVVSTYGWKS